MGRINTNVSSMIAQNNLNRTSGDLGVRLQRLSTGLRINRGADDPAGLIVSERLRSEIRAIDAAVGNSERASSVIATTEGYLTEVSDLLNSIKSLVVQAANTGGMSREEIDANQLQIDSAIDSITRISNTASFAGLQLLNGSLEYTTESLDSNDIRFSRIDSVTFGTASSVDVDVEVVGPAETATLWLSGDAGGFSGELLSAPLTLEVAGPGGTQTITFASGTAQSAMVDAINLLKDSTGVSASFETSGLVLNSTEYGSEAFVSVRPVGNGGATFEAYPASGTNTPITRDTGVDVTAIVNGTQATGRGTSISLNSSALSLKLDLDETFATTAASTSSFTISGGGAKFQLGPSVQSSQQVGVGIQSVAASRLGGTSVSGSRYFLDSLKSGQDNALTSDRLAAASDILDAATTEVAVMRGRLGAFERNTVQTNMRSLQVGVENITASESKIRDADFAKETAALTRAQILNQAGTSVLATANASAQSVLSLLQ